MDKSESLIMSLDRKLLPGILALAFLLTMALSEVTLSRADEAGKQKMLRQAAQEWMQVGIEQHQRGLFEAARKSFRRAWVYRKYLTAAERKQLDEFLAKARSTESEGKQVLAGTQTVNESVEQARPTKAEPQIQKVKGSESLNEEGREQIGERPRKISGQPSEQKEQTDQTAEPVVVKAQAEEVSSPPVTVIKVESLMERFTRYCWWLYDRQRVLLAIGAALVVLLLILVARRQRTEPARTVYASPVIGFPPTIGTKLAGRKQDRRGIKGLGKGRLAYVPEGRATQKKWKKTIKQWKTLGGQIEQLRHGITERKQATEPPKEQAAEVRTAEEKLQHELMKCGRAEEHPKQQTDEVSVANEPLQRNKEWPRRSYKYEDSHRVIGKVKQKLCRKCKKWKAESDFHKNRSCKDGLARWCKECKAKAAREYRRRRTGVKD